MKMDSTSPPKTKVAWVATEYCEGHSVVIFHHHGLAAQRLGADELGREFDGVDISRAPEFDQFAGTETVPRRVLIEHGWWFECSGCTDRVEEEEKPLSEIITQGPHVFCNISCWAGWIERVNRMNFDFSMFKTRIRTSRPDLTFAKFTGGYPIGSPSAEFTFPGCRYGGTVFQEMDKSLTWRVARNDQAHWAAYELSRNPNQQIGES